MIAKVSDKSVVDQILRRFDNDVERSSNLDTSQEAMMDAPVMVQLSTEAALATSPQATRLLDIGSGARDHILKILPSRPDIDCDPADLCAPMHDKACRRVAAKTTGRVRTFQRDIREVTLGTNSCDIIIAAAVRHNIACYAAFGALKAA